MKDGNEGGGRRDKSQLCEASEGGDAVALGGRRKKQTLQGEKMNRTEQKASRRSCAVVFVVGLNVGSIVFFALDNSRARRIRPNKAT